MSDTSDQQYFQGPTPLMISQRILLGEGEINKPDSCNSFSSPDPKIPHLSKELIESVPFEMKKSQKNMRKSEYQSAYAIEEEVLSGGKPQFLKLIMARSHQNNFINNLWNKSYLRKLHQLSPFQIKALDDLKFESEIYPEKNEKTITNWETVKRMLSQIEVFTPYSKFIFLWDLFQILTYLLIFFWLPYKISFQQQSFSYFLGETDGNKNLEIILLTILSSDVIVGLNLAYIKKGQIIRDRKKIIIHYFKVYSFVDLVSISTVTIQFFLVTNDSSEQGLSLLIQIVFCIIFYILRMTKINKILIQIQEFFNFSRQLNDFLGLVKVLMIILFIAHICACLWHGIAYYNPAYSWLDAYELRHSDNTSKYNTAIYWATMTMTTVGYGDITAKNNIELLVNNIIMFVASIVFAYSVNSVGIFVSNMYKSTMELNKSVSLINTYMIRNNIPFQLQTRIRSYLEYIWQEEQNMTDEEISQIISKLSSRLQDELQFQLRGNIVKNCKFINDTFSEQMIKSLLTTMEEYNFSPEERIITMNQNDDCSIYIITKGEVELIFEGTNIINEKVKRNSLRVLKQGEYFGELSFYTGSQRTATAISKGFSKLFKIKRENFLKVLSTFPNEYEKYCQARDLLINGEYNALQMKCYSCQSQFHLISQCNYLHFCPDKEALIKKDQYPRTQFRDKKYQRKQQEKTSDPIKMQHYLAQRAKDFMLDFYETNLDEEQEEAEQNTNMMQDGFTYQYESKAEIDVPSSLNQRSNSRTLSRVSQKPINQNFNEEEDDNNKFARKSANRGTLQTAGFGNGSLRDSRRVDITRDYQVDQEIIEESSSEDKDQIVQLPQMIRKPSVERTPQQKITFVRNQSTEDIIPRSASIKSRTYTKLQQDLLRRSMTPEKVVTPEKQQQSEQDVLRKQVKRLSTVTKTFTKVQQQELTEQGLNQTSAMDNNTQQTPIISSIFNGFDKMQIFTFYFPLNNYNLILKRYQKLQKFFGKKRLYPESSKYSFFFMTIKKGWKLRKLGDQLSGLSVAETLKKPFSKTIQNKVRKTHLYNGTIYNNGISASPKNNLGIDSSPKNSHDYHAQDENSKHYKVQGQDGKTQHGRFTQSLFK